MRGKSSRRMPRPRRKSPIAWATATSPTSSTPSARATARRHGDSSAAPLPGGPQVELALVAEADRAREIGADVFHVSIAGKAVTAMLAPPTAIQAIVSLAARPTFGAPLRSAKSPGDSLVKNLH